MAAKSGKNDGPVILVVDDNHHMRVLIIEILKAIGVRQIYEANDGSEALNLMRLHTIEIVICDIAMQPVDGLDFVRLLRNSSDSPAPMMPVIMISGHSTASKVYEARDVGVNEFLVKPITARGVLDRISKVIDHPRPYVRCEDYFGPDRRRRADPKYTGPWRRQDDNELAGQAAAEETVSAR